MGESYLNRIIKTGGTTTEGYVRPTGVPDGDSIIANAQVINSGGVNYYPIYYICCMDTISSRSFTKTGTGVASGADAYVFSDDPSTLYVGDTTHTFNTASDYATSGNWKCRYVIAYATEANKNASNGIIVTIYSYTDVFEFIGSQYLKFSSSSALFGNSTSAGNNLKYANLTNSSFYNNTISVTNFMSSCKALETLLLPTSLTSITGSSCMSGCSSLTHIVANGITTLSASILQSCVSLKSLSLPALKTISVSSGYFGLGCTSLKYFEIPSTITSITLTSTSTLESVQYIKLPTNFNIDDCNFTGATGYSKSISWFTHLATQLYDNSGGTVHTMTLGATNILLIPSAQAAIISAKNWTLS